MQNICEWKQAQPFPRQYMVSSNGEVYSTRAKKIILVRDPARKTTAEERIFN